MREGYILTKLEAAELFLILSNARIKLTGKFKTSAEKYHKKFESLLIPTVLNNHKLKGIPSGSPREVKPKTIQKQKNIRDVTL